MQDYGVILYTYPTNGYTFELPFYHTNGYAFELPFCLHVRRNNQFIEHTTVVLVPDPTNPVQITFSIAWDILEVNMCWMKARSGIETNTTDDVYTSTVQTHEIIFPF